MSEKIAPDEKKESFWDRRRKEAGLRLREERNRLGISQTDFAEQAGVSRGSQVNYESGEREPDAAYYEAIAKLGASLTYIHEGERIEGLPSFAGSIAERIFKKADTALNHDAMAMLFYLFGLNEVYEIGGLAQSFSEDQETALIQAAFQDGETFWEAAEAIAKYAPRLGKPPLGEEPTPRLRAELILETLKLYDQVKERRQVSLRDTIRLIADDLVGERSSS